MSHYAEQREKEYEYKEYDQGAYKEPSEKYAAGGTYFDKVINPLEYIMNNDLGFLEGHVVSYVSRWKTKGGLKDLKAAQYYLEQLIELAEYANFR